MANSDHSHPPRKPRPKELPKAKPWRESSDLYGWRFHDQQGAKLIIRNALRMNDDDPANAPELVIEYP